MKGLFTDDQIRARAPNIAADALPRDLPAVPPNVEEEGNCGSLSTIEPRSSPQCVLGFVDRSPRELPEPPVQQPEQTAKLKLAALKSVKKKPRSQTTSVPLKRRFSWPGLPTLSTIPQTDGEDNQSTTEPRSLSQRILDFLNRRLPERTAKPKFAPPKLVTPKKNQRSQTTRIAEREPLKRQFSWPGLPTPSTIPQTDGENNQPRPGLMKRARKNVMSPPGRGWNQLYMVVKVIIRFKRLRRRRLQLRYPPSPSQEAQRFPLKPLSPPALPLPPTNRSSREDVNNVLDLRDQIASTALYGPIGPPAGTKIEPPKGKQREFTDWDSEKTGLCSSSCPFVDL